MIACPCPCSENSDDLFYDSARKENAFIYSFTTVAGRRRLRWSVFQPQKGPSTTTCWLAKIPAAIGARHPQDLPLIKGSEGFFDRF